MKKINPDLPPKQLIYNSYMRFMPALNDLFAGLVHIGLNSSEFGYDHVVGFALKSVCEQQDRLYKALANHGRMRHIHEALGHFGTNLWIVILGGTPKQQHPSVEAME